MTKEELKQYINTDLLDEEVTVEYILDKLIDRYIDCYGECVEIGEQYNVDRRSKILRDNLRNAQLRLKDLEEVFEDIGIEMKVGDFIE